MRHDGKRQQTSEAKLATKAKNKRKRGKELALNKQKRKTDAASYVHEMDPVKVCVGVSSRLVSSSTYGSLLTTRR